MRDEEKEGEGEREGGKGEMLRKGRESQEGEIRRKRKGRSKGER